MVRSFKTFVVAPCSFKSVNIPLKGSVRTNRPKKTYNFTSDPQYLTMQIVKLGSIVPMNSSPIYCWRHRNLKLSSWCDATGEAMRKYVSHNLGEPTLKRLHLNILHLHYPLLPSVLLFILLSSVPWCWSWSRSMNLLGLGLNPMAASRSASLRFCCSCWRALLATSSCSSSSSLRPEPERDAERR